MYIINVLTSSVVHNKSPYEMLFNIIPDYAKFKMFGYACFCCFIHTINTNWISDCRVVSFLATTYKIKVTFVSPPWVRLTFFAM